MNMQLKSVTLTSIDKIKRHEMSQLGVVCKRGGEEWRSKASNDVGFKAVWEEEVCSISYKEVKNLVFIEIRDALKPVSKALAECNCTVEHLMAMPDG